MYKKIIKQAFKLNKVQVSLQKPICAAICAGLPIIIGLLFNHAKYGMWGSIGGFTYLYLFNEPYAQRIKKMFVVALSITTCSTLGIIVSDSPKLAILLVGLIGAAAIFMFGILKIPGPGPLFFVMTFSMTTGMKIDKSQIPIFMLVVLASSLFSWAVSMIGYFFNPYEVETKKVKMLYLDLLQFSKSIGSDDISVVRSKLVNTLKGTEEIITTGYIEWKVSFDYNKLYLLSEYANRVYIEMLELDMDKKIPEEIIEVLENLKNGIDLESEKKINLKKIEKGIYKDYDKLLEIIYDIESIVNLPEEYIGKGINISKSSMFILIKKSIDKNSIVFTNALRYGIVLSFSAFVANQLNIPKSYWIILSCSAVMCGSSVIATFYRALQRSIGTVIGVVFAILISFIHPQGYLVAVISMALTILTEIFIARNYAIASIFITPNAILIAESSSNLYSFSSLATSRIINIIIGSMIGLIGTYLIGRRSASSRLPELMAKTLHSQSKVIFYLSKRNDEKIINICKQRMEIDFNNFKLAYNTALGEIPNNEERLEMMWPAVFSLEHINYILCKYCSDKQKLNLSKNELEKLIFIYESMANNIEQGTNIEYEEIEYFDNNLILYKEIEMLQKSLIIEEKYNYIINNN